MSWTRQGDERADITAVWPCLGGFKPGFSFREIHLNSPFRGLGFRGLGFRG